MFFIWLILFISFLTAEISFECSPEYENVKDGCYRIINNSSFTWNNANKFCQNEISLNSGLIHLIALETKFEFYTIAFWLKGLNYDIDFWTDGISSKNGHVWMWNNQSVVFYNELNRETRAPPVMTTEASGFITYKRIDSGYYEIVNEPGSELNGFICEEQIPCSINFCKNDGKCYLNNGKLKCLCEEGNYGWFCEKTIDPCASFPQPCLNYGVCESVNKTYICKCPSSYIGTHCETELHYAYENTRKTVTGIVLTIFTLIIVAFCLMDLPWDLIQETFKQTTGSKESKTKKDKILFQQTPIATHVKNLKRLKNGIHEKFLKALKN